METYSAPGVSTCPFQDFELSVRLPFPNLVTLCNQMAVPPLSSDLHHPLRYG
jgi:hypothetical protein